MEKFLVSYMVIIIVCFLYIDYTNYFIKKSEYKCTKLENTICYVYEKSKRL